MNLKELTKEIPYKWRTGPGGKQLAYIDSRDVQDLLDEVVGPENWQSDFKLIDGKLFGGIGICVDRKEYIKNGMELDGGVKEWVWKWDCGTESNIEEEKGQVSDALKRAGVQWGIGRFLYDIKDGSKSKIEPSGGMEMCTRHNEQKQISKAGKLYCLSCVKEYRSGKVS